jgi:hypothetical protein
VHLFKNIRDTDWHGFCYNKNVRRIEMKRYITVFMTLFVTLFFCSSLLKAQEQETKYTNDSFARLSYISGNAYIQKGPDLAYEEGVVNMPIEEGDRLGTTDGRAEIYLGRSNYVRLDNNTKLDFLNLPKKGYDLVRLRVWNGNIYLSVNRLEKEKGIEVHTADASFYVLDEGLYRIDVQENKKTQILVFRGVIEAAGEEGSQLLKSEQTLEVTGGRFTSRPERFFAVAEDSFDRWSDFRESHIRVEVADRRLPEELADFESELDQYGEWINVPPYGLVWKPGNVDQDWRPYYNGSWVWLSLGGWTWLPYEPWGWAPFHYGRWGWGPGFGWYWIPTSMWGPAWVNWWWGYDYWGWAPLSWWGYPVVIIDGAFYGNYYGRYYPYNSRALTIIHKDQLRAKNISSVALRQDALKGLKGSDKISLSSTPPAIRPTFNKVSVEGMQGNKVFPKREPGQTAVVSERGLEPGSSKGPERVAPAQSGEKGGQRVQSPGERRIRKTDSPQSLSSGWSRSTVRKNSYGYPPSPNISIRKYSYEKLGPRSSSIRDQLYRYLQGDRASSRSSSSRGSVSKGRTTSSGSRGTVSSGSRGSSSGAHSASPGSGSVRKKG